MRVIDRETLLDSQGTSPL